MTDETPRKAETPAQARPDEKRTHDHHDGRSRTSDPGNSLASGVETNPIAPGRTGGAHTPS